MNSWNGKPYHSLDFHLKEMFGRKVYKLALDGGMTCPNRDGSVGRGGCIFCSQGGSGDFAAKKRLSLREQADLAKKLVEKKAGPDALYIAYFQSYTNTYAPLPYLEALFTEAVSLPEVCALSIGTRPDCLPDETVALLSRLNQEKPVWVERQQREPGPFVRAVHNLFARCVNAVYDYGYFVGIQLLRSTRGKRRRLVHSMRSWREAAAARRQRVLGGSGPSIPPKYPGPR